MRLTPADWTEALTCFLLSPSRSTVVATYTTSSMATMSSAATGCGTSTPRARWPNRTWWPVRTARRSSSTPSGPWSPSRSCWCGTVRSFPRDSAASRSNQTAWSQVSHGLRDYPTLFGIGEGKTAWSDSLIFPLIYLLRSLLFSWGSGTICQLPLYFCLSSVWKSGDSFNAFIYTETKLALK